VRELANTLERAAILADDEHIQPAQLAVPGRLAGAPVEPTPPPSPPAQPATASAPAAGKTIAELERDAIAASLTRHDGNRTRVAEELGIGVRTLYDKIKRHGL